MTTLKFLSAAALIVAAMLATPAMAHESRVTSQNSNRTATLRAYHIDEGDPSRGYESHDAWGHCDTYYGPMIPSAP
jgi:hypothetical protein